MQASIRTAAITMALIVGLPALGFAQGTYSGKAVYGRFGPRVLGETLQSPVVRTDRGIARDAYGDFLGRNRDYPGALFSSTPRPTRAQAPAAPAQGPALAPEQAPEAPAGPDQWLRSRGPGAEAAPEAPEGSAPSESGVPPSAGGRVAPAAAPVVAVTFGPTQSGPSPAEDIATMLQRTRRISRQSSIRVIVRNETAILRGEVATPHDQERAGGSVPDECRCRQGPHLRGAMNGSGWRSSLLIPRVFIRTIDSLVRTHVVRVKLERAYREMAHDEIRERDALDFIEATLEVEGAHKVP